jgi:hypothetical protein
VAGSNYTALKNLQALRVILETISPTYRVGSASQSALEEAAEAAKRNFGRVLDLAALANNIFGKGVTFSETNQTRNEIRNRKKTISRADTLAAGSHTPAIFSSSLVADAFSPEEKQVLLEEAARKYREQGSNMPDRYDWVEEAFDAHYQQGYDALAHSLVAGTLTAFEVLAGDLWEAALNVMPDPLAMEYGNVAQIHGRMLKRYPIMMKDKKKFVQQDNQQFNKTQDRGKRFTITQIAEASAIGRKFDLHGHIGTLMRRKYEFSVLAQIREAYSKAFDCDPTTIVEALSDNSLDALDLVRNVIAHQAGKVDATYLAKINGTPAPEATEGGNLDLNGTVINDLLTPVFHCAADLVKGVDAWLKDEADGKHSRRQT